MATLMRQNLAGRGSLPRSRGQPALWVTKSTAGNLYGIMARCRGRRLLDQDSFGKIPTDADDAVRPRDACGPAKRPTTARVAAGGGKHLEDAPLRFKACLAIDPETGSCSQLLEAAGEKIIPHRLPSEPPRPRWRAGRGRLCTLLAGRMSRVPSVLGGRNRSPPRTSRSAVPRARTLGIIHPTLQRQQNRFVGLRRGDTGLPATFLGITNLTKAKIVPKFVELVIAGIPEQRRPKRPSRLVHSSAAVESVGQLADEIGIVRYQFHRAPERLQTFFLVAQPQRYQPEIAEAIRLIRVELQRTPIVLMGSQG